jgi:dihydrofolate reductase
MINAIFAVDTYGGMGYNGSLPWPHNAEDLARFKKLTENHVVVMGSNTWHDPKMPKPLPGRTVYVASSKPVLYGSRISGNIVEEVLKLEQDHPNKIIWVIGGPKLIEECSKASIFDYLYLTHFKGSYKIDTKIDLRSVLNGTTPTRAEVSNDRKSVFVKYAPIFKRITTSS